MTLYKGDRNLTVDPADYKARRSEYDAKGWSRDRKATPATKQPASPQGGQEQPFTKPGFMAGAGAGLNPFHGTPDNMPVKGTMGGVANAAADTLNMREITNRAMTGDTSGAIGQTAGTVASLVGPAALKAGGKALKASGMAARAMKEVPMIAKAADKATTLAKSIRVSPEIARYASRYTMPLFNAIDKRFEAVHQALDQGIIPMSSKASQLVRRMAAKAEIPSVAKIAEELKGRTALGYREAEALRRTFMDMVGAEAEHWSPQIHQLAQEIDIGIDALAKTKGMDVMRKEYRALYKETMDLSKAVASTAKTKVGKLRTSAGTAIGAVNREAGAAITGGIHTGQETVMHIAPVVEAKAKKLAAKLGVPMEELLAKASGMEKAGGAMAKVGATGMAAQAGRLLPRDIQQMITSMMSGQQNQPPSQGKQ